MEDLSNAVGSNYIIVKNIIKHMSWRQAEVAERVCELWQEVVKELRKTELHVQHFHFTFLNERLNPPASFVTSAECFGVPELLITLQRQFADGGPFRCPLNPCPITIDGRSRVCPYCTENALFKHACSFCNSDTKVIAIMSPGMLYVQSPIRKGLGNFMGGLAIPKIPGVQVNLLDITNEDCSDPSKFYHELNEIMDKNIIKCLLVFIKTGEDDEREEKFVIKMIERTQTKQRRTHPTCHFAVCGCITYNPMDFPTLTDSSENITKVIVFSVNKSEIDSVQYNAFSSVFSSCSESKSTMVNDFTNQMKKISDLIPRRKYGISIKVSCLRRTLDFSCENDILAEHFPNMPIVICTSSLELGVNCLPENEASNIKEVRKDMYDNCTHFSSTVILIMSWGRLL